MAYAYTWARYFRYRASNWDGSRRAASTSTRSRSSTTTDASVARSRLPNTGPAIALHPDPDDADVHDLPSVDATLPVGYPGIGDDERARGRVDAERVHRRGAVAERHEAARRRLALGPAREIECPRPERVDPDLHPLREGVEQGVGIDGAAARRLVQARHRRGERRWEVARGPVGVDPHAHDEARVVRAEALRLAQHARELAQRQWGGEAGGGGVRGQLAHEERPRSPGLDHEVVRPLQADRADGQPGDLLGGVAHRECDRGRDAPRSLRRDPAGSEAERAQEGGPGWRRPASTAAATTRGLLAGDGEADLRLADGQPLTDDVVRRADAGEPLGA